MKSKFYNNWNKIIKANNNKIINFKIIGKVDRGNNDEKLSILDTEIETKKGDKLSRAIILESPSVVIVPVLKFLNKKNLLLLNNLEFHKEKRQSNFLQVL